MWNPVLKKFIEIKHEFISEFGEDRLWDYENGFYMECRGLVLDMDEEVVVLTPFRKFRNLNEGKGYYIDEIKT